MIEVDWTTFMERYLAKKEIYAIEKDDRWELYTAHEVYKIKCIVEKSADAVDNITFVERYFNRPNIIIVRSVGEDEHTPEPEEETSGFSEILPAEEEIGEQMELKHKYIRRVGRPGNYRYFYRQPMKKPAQRQEQAPLAKEEEYQSPLDILKKELKVEFDMFARVKNYTDSSAGMYPKKDELFTKEELLRIALYFNKHDIQSPLSRYSNTELLKKQTNDKSLIENLFSDGIAGIKPNDAHVRASRATSSASGGKWKEETILTPSDYDDALNNLGDSYEDVIVGFRDNKYKIAGELHDKGGGLDSRGEIMRELSKRLYKKYSDEIQNSLIATPKRYDPRDVTPEDVKRWRAAIDLGQYSASHETVSGEGERMAVIEQLRKKTNNDTLVINKVLGYMRFKERVKKDGLRKTPDRNKTKEDIKNSLASHEHNGVKYNVSPTFFNKLKDFRGKRLFASDKEMHSFIKKSLDRLPPKTGQQLAKTNTEVNIVGKAEEKILRGAYRGVGHTTAGIYDPNTKQVYIYPKTFHNNTTIDIDKLKADGISDEAISKLTHFDEKENWGQIIIHEVGHAIQLNLAGKKDLFGGGEGSPIEQAWDKMKGSDKYKELERRTSPGEKDNRYISKYAKTNDHEDMAETFAYYARYRPYIKEAVNRKKEWINPVLAEKFKFMERLWK